MINFNYNYKIENNNYKNQKLNLIKKLQINLDNNKIII